MVHLPLKDCAPPQRFGGLEARQVTSEEADDQGCDSQTFMMYLAQ